MKELLTAVVISAVVAVVVVGGLRLSGDNGVRAGQAPYALASTPTEPPANATAIAIATSASTPAVAATSSSSGGGASAGGPGVVNVDAKEFTLAATPSQAPGGQVTMRLNNAGAIGHELRVIKSDLGETALPQTSGIVDEGKVSVALKIPEIAAGKNGQASANLSAGKYILICNIAGHYQLGMHASFTVQ